MECASVNKSLAGERFGIYFLFFNMLAVVDKERRGIGIHTLRIVLQDVHVEICVDDEDIQLTLEWKELGRYNLHLRSRLAEEGEFIRFLLRVEPMVSKRHLLQQFLTEQKDFTPNPPNQTPFHASAAIHSLLLASVFNDVM
jgi:hypothetical protein